MGNCVSPAAARPSLDAALPAKPESAPNSPQHLDTQTTAQAQSVQTPGQAASPAVPVEPPSPSSAVSSATGSVINSTVSSSVGNGNTDPTDSGSKHASVSANADEHVGGSPSTPVTPTHATTSNDNTEPSQPSQTSNAPGLNVETPASEEMGGRIMTQLNAQQPGTPAHAGTSPAAEIKEKEHSGHGRSGSEVARSVTPDPVIGKYLRHFPLFAHLRSSERAKLGGALETILFNNGDWVFKQGDNPTGFYIIKDGKAEVISEDAKTKHKTHIITLSKGDYFGETALLTNDKRAAGVRASGGLLSCYFLEKTKFNALISEQRIPIRFANRRVAISAEKQIGGAQLREEEGKETSALSTTAKSLPVRELILRSIDDNVLFRNLDSDHKERIVEAMWINTIKTGVYAITQGDMGNKLYVVETGAFDVLRTDKETGGVTKVATRGPGTCFGELALMYNAPRAASVVATQDSIVWVVDRYTFRRIAQNVGEARIKRYADFLRNVPLLRPLAETERVKVAEAIEEIRYPANATIFRQGQEGDALYIVAKGEVVVSKKDDSGQSHPIGKCVVGDYFGERALLKKEPRAATIAAAPGGVMCLKLDRSAFDLLLGPLEDIMNHQILSYETKKSLQDAPDAQIRDESFDGRNSESIHVVGGLEDDHEHKKHPDKTSQQHLGNPNSTLALANISVTPPTPLAPVTIPTPAATPTASNAIHSSFPPPSPSASTIPTVDLVQSVQSPAALTIPSTPTAASASTALHTPSTPNNHPVASTLTLTPAVTTAPTPTAASSATSASAAVSAPAPVAATPKHDEDKHHSSSSSAASNSTSSTGHHSSSSAADGGDLKPEHKTGHHSSSTSSNDGSVSVTKTKEKHKEKDKDKDHGKHAPNVPTTPGGTRERELSDSEKNAAELNSENIQFEDLKVLATLGKGSFGFVQLVKHKKTGKIYALKGVSKEKIVKTKQQGHILSEKRVMSVLRHPFLIRLYATFKSRDRLYFLMEPCLGGELFTILRRRRLFPESTARFYAAHVVLAFEYMHSKQTVYRDLKPENLLLDNKGYLKLTDFGFAKQLKTQQQTWTLCGTPEYLSPEIVAGKGHGLGVDWWTLGILIYEMLASYTPFYHEDHMKMYQRITRGEVRYPSHFSAEAKDLVSQLLVVQPTKRLGVVKGGAQLVKDHPWFRGFNWNALLKHKLKAPIIPKVKSKTDTSNFDDFPEAVNEVKEYVDDGTAWDADF